jgi:glycosyltransferase involved in cell wall biosynthesis
MDEPQRSQWHRDGAPPVLLHVFHSFGCGGAQTRFIHLANHFAARLRHVIIAMNGDYSAMNVLRPESSVAMYGPRLSKGSSIWQLPKRRGALAAVQPDCLVTHNWGTVDWALAWFGHRSRHIHIEDGFGPDEAEAPKLRRNLARRVLLRRSQVVVPSETLRRIALERWKISQSSLHYIPNGIDCARFTRALSLRSSSAEPIVGTVTALRAEKNHARLLRAIAIVRRERSVRLVIVGDGPQRPILQSLADSLGLQDAVSFKGHISDPAPLYRSFDLFALTSDTEQMPYTVLEAMAAGLPIVATDVGDIRSMVSAENASLIVERDENKIAAAILELIRNQDIAQRLGEANATRARQRYDQSVMFAEFAKLYRLDAERG